jgi:hypothetical protein
VQSGAALRSNSIGLHIGERIMIFCGKSSFYSVAVPSTPGYIRRALRAGFVCDPCVPCSIYSRRMFFLGGRLARCLLLHAASHFVPRPLTADLSRLVVNDPLSFIAPHLDQAAKGR